MKELGWNDHLTRYDLKDLEQMQATLDKERPPNYTTQSAAIKKAIEAVKLKREINHNNEKIKELLREMKSLGLNIPMPYDVWGF